MKSSIIVPSISRPKDLGRCLQGILHQSTTPYEVLVVTQKWDTPTIKLATDLGAEVLLVPYAGLAHAIEYGIRHCRGEIACFTDDDAVPRPDWLERIQTHFLQYPDVGIVCGRDVLSSSTEDTKLLDDLVGVIRGGKLYGNHHLGGGVVRQVDHAKGANMSVRIEPARQIDLAARVRGDGAQVGNEVVLSLGISSLGYKCLFDPSVLVDHYPAERPGNDSREIISYEKVVVRAYNRAYGVARFAPLKLLVLYLFRSLIIGDRMNPGLVLTLYLSIRDAGGTLPRFCGSLIAVFEAYMCALMDRIRGSS